jgi:hypothetical protein
MRDEEGIIIRPTIPAHAFATPLPGEPELASVTMERDLARWEASAKLRDEQTLLPSLAYVFAIAAVISFMAFYGIAAVVDRGWENIQAHRAEGIPT